MQHITASPETQAIRRPSQAGTWRDEAKTGFILSNDPQAAPYNPPKPVPCEFCGAPRYTQGFWLFDRVKWAFHGPERCTCPEAVEAYEREKAEQEAKERERKQRERDRQFQALILRNIGESGMNRRFLRRTFEAFELTAENERAFRACKAYADTFRDKLPDNCDGDPGRNGLFITGPKGTGKTHLAAAIANQLMQQGTAAICMTMIDLLERIRRTYDQRHQAGASEANILSTYKEVPLLVIDDMGKEPATEWAVSKVYAIINARYEAYMPTIVTTNYSDAELVRRLTPRDGDSTTADAAVDRLREMCAGILTSGESWRGR